METTLAAPGKTTFNTDRTAVRTRSFLIRVSLLSTVIKFLQVISRRRRRVHSSPTVKIPRPSEPCLDTPLAPAWRLEKSRSIFCYASSLFLQLIFFENAGRHFRVRLVPQLRCHYSRALKVLKIQKVWNLYEVVLLQLETPRQCRRGLVDKFNRNMRRNTAMLQKST